MKSVVPDLPSRIPSLDGLRAISILMVLLGHVADQKTAPRVMHVFTHWGNMGVRVFFVISGFLITTLLVKEHVSTGGISLNNFYLRRTVRIMPAAYVLIAVVAILAAVGWTTVGKGDILHAITYTQNYHRVPQWILDHLWSLSVEEQFYLIWPSLLVFAGIAAAFRSAWAVIFLAPAIRCLGWFIFHPSLSAYTRDFEMVADTLAAGCLLCAYYNRLGTLDWYRRFQNDLMFWPCAIALTAGGNLLFMVNPGFFYIIGQSLCTLGTVLIIDWAVRKRPPFLNARVLTFIGVLSYSLYLWQEVFINPYVDHFYTRFPASIAAVFIVALASYYLIERPFLRLRRKLERNCGKHNHIILRH